MSALLRRVRRLEREQEPKGGRLIVVSVPYCLDNEARSAFLQGQGIRATEADLVLWVHSFRPTTGPALPRLLRNEPLA